MSECELSELRGLLGQMTEGVGIYDLDGAIRYINPAAERVLGKSLAEARGQRLFELVHPVSGARFQAAFARVAAGGDEESFELYHPESDAWFHNRVTRAGGRIHVVARDVTSDVRQRRKVETLAKIAEVLGAEELELAPATSELARILSQVIDADCTLALLSEDGEWLELVGTALRDADAGELARSMPRWRASAGHPGEALRSKTAILAQAEALAESRRSTGDERLRDLSERYELSSLLVVPLYVADEAVGVLFASRRAGAPPLTSDDRSFTTSIAPSVGLYLAHARRRTEAASLRQRLSNLADALPALVSFVDRDERYQYVNAAYTRWFNRGREAFVGRTVREATPDGAYAKIAPHVRQALSGIPVRYRARFQYPVGARDVDVQYLPMSTPGGIEGFGVLVQDITTEMRIAALEREQLEAERRSARRLESLLRLAGKLAGASRPEEVARVVVDEGVEALDASLGGMFVLSPDGRELVLLRERGFSRAQSLAFARVPLDGNGPLSDAFKSRRPVWVASREDYAARYPELEAKHRPEPAPPLAFAVLPFFVDGGVSGCVNYTFHDERRLTANDRTYLEVLAYHCVEALQRAHLWTELKDVSETRAAMIQASPAAIVLMDEAGVVHAWNAAAERIFGWSASDVIGRVLPAADDRPEEFWQLLEHVLAGNVIQGRAVRRMRGTGEWLDLEIHAAPVSLSQGRTLYLSIFLDVTDRKRAERGRQLVADVNKVLTRSLDLNNTLADVVRLPLSDFADWCCVDVLEDSRTLRRMAMSRADAAQGAPPAMRLAHEPARGGASLAIETGQPQVLHDIDEPTLLRLARDAEHLAVLRALRMRSSVSVPLTVKDRVLGALSFASASRNFDDLDREIASELARHVATAMENARLFDDAQRARSEAEAASRAKDEFLAILGHELRNPLAPISTALELMRMREPQALLREREIIARQVTHLSRLVDDLLDVSRITRGQVELRRESLKLEAIVARAIEMTRPLVESKQHRLTLDVPASLSVFGDATRLGQVVANLLSNAAKYTPRGGSITVRGAAQGGDVVLAVRDNGIGVAPEMLPRIFDIFVQAPQPSARTEGGLGIGLAIVKSLVAAHGGRVEAASEGLGKGAEIRVRLPAAASSSAAAESTAPVTPRSGPARRVLVVDDNEDGANLLAELLALHGHDVATAYDGPSALQVAERFHPEVAILDLGLPVMDGYELARQLHARQPLRLIAVTGYGRESDRESTREAGFDAHLAKPVAMEALLPLVEQASH